MRHYDEAGLHIQEDEASGGPTVGYGEYIYKVSLLVYCKDFGA
jgi:hypothetical protein